jgi:hypothetical protein
MLGQSGGNGVGQVRRKLEAHLGELHADIGFELALGDGVEQTVIDLCRLVRFGLGGDAFAQRIERRCQALAY